MNTLLRPLALAALTCLALSTAQADPLILPNPTAGIVASGSFSISETQQITLTGKPISLSTTLPTKSDQASGTYTYKSGTIQYDDGSSKIDGQMSKVLVGRHVVDGQVTYMLKGLIFGVLTQGGDKADVKGNFSVTTQPAPEGTTLAESQVASSDIILTARTKSSGKGRK